MIRIPQWKKVHDAAQARGGTFILPDGRKQEISGEVSCKRLASIYGDMIKTAKDWITGGGSVRSAPEIRIELQTLRDRAERALSAVELREALHRFARLTAEVQRDHPTENDLAQALIKDQRDAIGRFRERFGQERLENV